MAPEKSRPFVIAAMATSGESALPRGTPCWSTTINRTVRSQGADLVGKRLGGGGLLRGVQAVTGDEPWLAHAVYVGREAAGHCLTSDQGVHRGARSSARAWQR